MQTNRRNFLRLTGATLAAVAVRGWAEEKPAARPNVLMIVADDLGCFSVGAFGCPIPGVTPNLDRLAAQGMKFERAHVTVAVCQPSRNTLFSGRYPHRSGGEGFFHLRKPGLPILPDLLQQAGYRTAILGKTGHSTPYASFKWDLRLDGPQVAFGRSPAVYAKHLAQFMDDAAQAGRPFFFMANSHDPHRPFFGNDNAEWYRAGGANPPAVKPSRVFSPGEIKVPGFLPDLPPVRLEMSEYYSSVRRLDDTVGALLAVLEEKNAADNTLVVFLSDNGISIPFAKTNCYLHSTRTPLIVRWPGRVRAGAADRDHFVSGIDFMPTVLEAAGLPRPEGMDGVSFLPLLRGEKQAGRERLFTQFYQTSGRRNFPMFCVQDGRYGYLFNPWSNGTRRFANESQAGRTMDAMEASSDPAVAKRVKHFLYRTVEEFYDLEKDPDALDNRIADPALRERVDALRKDLEQWMERTQNPALAAFRKRDKPAALETYMKELGAIIGEKVPGAGGRRAGGNAAARRAANRADTGGDEE